MLLLAIFLPALALAGHGIDDLVNNIPAEHLKKLLDAGEKVVLIDLRPAKEFQKNRLPGARSIPLAELEQKARAIPKTERVVLYCDCLLYQIVQKAKYLEDQGYRNIAVMLDGFLGWVKLGYPVDTGRR